VQQRDVASLTADGAYDGEAVYDAVVERHPVAVVIIPARATAVANETTATQRDQHNCRDRKTRTHRVALVAAVAGKAMLTSAPVSKWRSISSSLSPSPLNTARLCSPETPDRRSVEVDRPRSARAGPPSDGYQRRLHPQQHAGAGTPSHFGSADRSRGWGYRAHTPEALRAALVGTSVMRSA
jgi:hypothetical protein